MQNRGRLAWMLAQGQSSSSEKRQSGNRCELRANLPHQKNPTKFKSTGKPCSGTSLNIHCVDNTLVSPLVIIIVYSTLVLWKSIFSNVGLLKIPFLSFFVLSFPYLFWPWIIRIRRAFSYTGQRSHDGNKWLPKHPFGDALYFLFPLSQCLFVSLPLVQPWLLWFRNSLSYLLC